MTALDKAIKIAGGIRPLGRAIGAWPSQIHKWVNQYGGRVPTVNVYSKFILLRVLLRMNCAPIYTQPQPAAFLTIPHNIERRVINANQTRTYPVRFAGMGF